MEYLNELKTEYENYVLRKLGPEAFKKTPNFYKFKSIDGKFMFEEACRAAQNVSKNYDLGISLAVDGLWLGYILEKSGFPVKAVKLKRKGNGATWKELDKLDRSEIENKKLILLDNDSITGRTIKRAANEIHKYNPEFIDLLLVFEQTPITVKTYKSFKEYNFKTIEEIFLKLNIKEIEEVKEGIIIRYLDKYNKEEIIFKENEEFLFLLNTRTNITKEIRKIFTLEKDFQNYNEFSSNLEIMLKK